MGSLLTANIFISILYSSSLCSVDLFFPKLSVPIFYRECVTNDDCVFMMRGNQNKIYFICENNTCVCKEDISQKGIPRNPQDSVVRILAPRNLPFNLASCSAGIGFPCGLNNGINVTCRPEETTCIDNSCYNQLHERQCETPHDCIFKPPHADTAIQFDCQNKKCACLEDPGLKREFDQEMYIFGVPLKSDRNRTRCTLWTTSFPCGEQDGINVSCRRSECIDNRCSREKFTRICSKSEDCIFQPPGVFDAIHLDCEKNQCVCSKDTFTNNVIEKGTHYNLHDTAWQERVDERCEYDFGSPCGFDRGINISCGAKGECINGRCRTGKSGEDDITYNQHGSCYADRDCIKHSPTAKCYVVKEKIVDRRLGMVARITVCAEKLPNVVRSLEKTCQGNKCYDEIKLKKHGVRGIGQICNQDSDCPQPLQCYLIQDIKTVFPESRNVRTAFCDESPPIPLLASDIDSTTQREDSANYHNNVAEENSSQAC